MSDKVKCEFCGKEYNPKGIEGHKRNCKENPENKSNEIAEKKPEKVEVEVITSGKHNYYEGHPRQIIKLRGLLSTIPFEEVTERAKIIGIIKGLGG